jgi:hypothetical protein
MGRLRLAARDLTNFGFRVMYIRTQTPKFG